MEAVKDEDSKTLEISASVLRSSGLAGVFGSALMFSGDMLFYYVPGSNNLLYNMSIVSFDRILISGLLALFSGWLFIIGCYHVYLAFLPASFSARVCVTFGMVMCMTGFAVVHSNYVGIALSAKVAREHGLDLQETAENFRTCNNALRSAIYPVFFFLSLVFIPQVWLRRTFYPRWMCAAFPAFTFLLQDPISRILSGTDAWTVIIGGYLNLMMFVFFSCSVVALWNTRITYVPSLERQVKESKNDVGASLLF